MSVAHAEDGLSAFSFTAGKFHVTADKTYYHSKTKVHEARGHVVMSARGKRLSSDYAWIDSKTGKIKVRGNVVFVTAQWTIHAAEMEFNADTGTGKIFYGTVSNDSYRLKGQLIRKISNDRFLTTEGEYTTCRDCPESWKLSAKSVDMTIDGYAFLESVYVLIKDVPTVYMPYLIVPVKTRRQTGFLFPRIGSGSRHGFTLVQPLFLAIDDHQDATLAYGRYAKRGNRGELEYRYNSFNGTRGIVNGFYTRDKEFKARQNRIGVTSEHNFRLLNPFDIRLRIKETSDRDYSREFFEDIDGRGLPALESNLVVSRNFGDIFVTADAKRYRSLIGPDDLNLDKDVVQTGPSVYAGLKDQLLFDNFYASIYMRYDRFYRSSGSFFDGNGNGLYDSFSEDFIREAQRLQVSPELSYTWRIGGVWDVQPSLRYNERIHFFNVQPNTDNVETLTSRYLLGRVRSSTTLERVWESDSPSTEAWKHLITPFVSYANIPYFSESQIHPFNTQIQREGGTFDQFDVIPVQNDPDNFREPLGNAISYGFTSRIIQKKRKKDRSAFVYPYDLVRPKKKKYKKPKNRAQEILIDAEKRWDKYAPDYDLYRQVWLFSVNQAYDIREAKKDNGPNAPPPAPFSPLLVRSEVTLDNFSNYVEYQYKPYALLIEDENRYEAKHDLNIAAAWTLKSLANASGTLFFKRAFRFGFGFSSGPNLARNISGGLTWSFNDFFSVDYDLTYNLVNKEKISEKLTATFNSPSECWRLRLNYSREQTGTDFGFDLGINLMGTGYVGMNSPQGGLPGVGN